MPKVRDVCSQVRSKNAGPFWVTVDLFFADHERYVRYRDSAALSAERIAALFGTDAALVRCSAVDRLDVLKISYPRPAPQGGVVERDMHAGQQFVRLLSVELDVR